MLTGLRTWLAEAIRPAAAPAAATPALRLAAEAESPPPVGDDDDQRIARSDRLRRQAEDKAKRADERARAAEAAKRAAEEKARALDLELVQARERARSAETRAKKVGDERSAKVGRSKGKAPAAGARPSSGRADDRVRELEAKIKEEQKRAEAAERRLRDAEARVAAEKGRTEELQARLTQAEAAKRSEATPPARPSTPRRDAMARSAIDVHFSPGDECLFAICRQIDSAESTADVCVFTITDDRIAARLLDAHRRGVRVRIITDNDKAYDDGSDIHRLARAGIEVRVDQSPFHMHHKFAIFDERRMLTGSYNWTRGAARDNEENLLVSDDPRLLRAFGRAFASLWEKLAPG